MKNFVFLFLILVVLVFFTFPRVINFLTPQKSSGFLKIESIPEGISVFIDEKEVGVTPRESNEIEIGMHKVKLTGENLGWEGKIEIAAGVESFLRRILGPGDSFSGGVTVFYQKTKNGTSNPSLAITAKPKKVKVTVDNKEYEVPVILEGVTVDKHKLKFSLEGYLTEEVEAEAKNGFLTNVDVEMMVNPFGETEISTEKEEMIIAEDRIITEREMIGTEIVSRSEWGGESLDISDSKLTLAPWRKIEVYPIIFPQQMLAPEIIKGMDFYARGFLGLPGTPFAYLITEQGEVYEGLGVRDFDFSSFESKLKIENWSASWRMKIDSGVCPVAYLSTTPELTNQAQEALKKLQSYLAGPPKNKAKLITVLQPITIAPTETREITLEFQNIGEATWERNGDKRTFLVTAPPKRASNFYTKDSWIAVDKVALPQEERVTPGQTAKFTFLLTTPFYPDEIIESLGLLIEGEDEIISGSEVSLEISIWAEGLATVEIKDTPTGFLNVRSGPSTYAELLGTVYPGEKYLFLGEEAGFYKIKLRDGSEGWVYAKYAEKK